jgi:hypothetical protein
MLPQPQQCMISEATQDLDRLRMDKVGKQKGPKRIAPTVLESYREFEPPENFRKTIETLLRYVPDEYLLGLRTIILTNRTALSKDQRRRKVWSHNRKILLADARGAYEYRSNSSPPTIWLYVDNICRTEPSWWRRVPLLRYMIPSDVLYHEIGHHIHATRNPVFEEPEAVAGDWTRKLWGRFLRRHYWYLFPIIWLFTRLASPVAKQAKWNRIQ